MRYEDLARATGDVLGAILHELGLPPWQADGINRSVAAFPPDADRLSYDVYFNETLQANDTTKRLARQAARRCTAHVKQFGYMPFLQEIMGNATTHSVKRSLRPVKPH